MKKATHLLALLILSLVSFSCSKSEDAVAQEPYLVIKFKFDPAQIRLNNLGQASVIPSTNAAQTPVFNTISSHYVELAPNATTLFGDGTILYHGQETTVGGAAAIDFSQSRKVAEGQTFLKIPLKSIATGSYQYIRISLSYQNYKISVLQSGVSYTGTLASFVGFNTYIGTDVIGGSSFPVNGNRPQGYWEFALDNIAYASSGQSVAGATTVPNPISATSPTPINSCVVTGAFATPLSITGQETNDVVITASLSINNSFEWKEVNFDGKYEPSAGEAVVDMGLRGLIPTYTK